MHDDFEDDFEIDNVLNNNNKKKKKDSGKKGRRGERGLITELNERFPDAPFSRTMGSGNRWSQAKLTETAKQVFTGDIVTPDNFIFVLECKSGYNDINLDLAIKRLAAGKAKGNAQLEKFLDQVTKDGLFVNKIPMLCWKKDYKPWLVFLRINDLLPSEEELATMMRYKEWCIIPLVKVLEKPDSFFFKE